MFCTNNTAHRRSVKPGVVEGQTTQVTGINPGDVVANSSFDKLQDNAKIIVSTKPIPAQPRAGVALLESIPSVYSATCRNLVADGRDFASRYCELHAAAGFGTA